MAANKSVSNGMVLGGIAGAALLFVVQNVSQVSFIKVWWNSLANYIITNVDALSTIPNGFMQYTLAILVGIIVGLYIEYK